MDNYGRQTGPAQLEFVREFEAAPHIVWQFLVEPEKRKIWFCGGSTGDHVGGKIVFEFDHRNLAESPPPEKYASEETATHHGEILEFDPPDRLAFTWFESAGSETSVVEITLRATETGGTTLKLVHKGVEGRSMLVGVLAGWHGHFDLLAEVLAGPRITDFWLRDHELEQEYEERV